MAYEWDQSKNRANLAKRGVDFADAVAVFEDDLALSRPDADSIVRIISARVATKQEREFYEG
jgi:uncharacterized DUF497 family protein